ncbi:MAG TPA: AMP-binding protein [Solirubrobacterales bacterium]|nr:AMP-binding protein [Solirubrobacterales bacterium]
MSEDASTLWDGILSGGHRTALHCWEGDGYEAHPWDLMAGDAERMTAGLRRAGVEPGTRVAAILTNGPQVVRGILGVWLAGGALASLPVPARGMDAEEYGRQLLAIHAKLEPVLFLLEERMLGLLPEDLREALGARSWESFLDTGRVEATPPGEDELAFIQFSSGSTSAPKGCMLTPRAILSQVLLNWQMIGGPELSEDDVGVTWLPLSHDMGLFGQLISAWVIDRGIYMSTPERFMLSPRTWFDDMAEVGAVLAAGTNTALHLAARSYRNAAPPRELAVKTCIVGGERVEWETLQLVGELLGPYGFRSEALMPAYGMAEATLAVTATPVSEPPRRIVVDAIALAEGELEEVEPDSPTATSVVSSGVPCRGVELPGASGELGEIRVRSDSLALGYYGDPGLTAERFRDGVLRTGDLGFVSDGYLYPVGRVDDVISIGGRKVYAREIEVAIEALEGVRRGCSTVVEQPDGGGGRLTLCVELKGEEGDYDSLAAEAATLAMAKAAVPLDACMFLPRGSLPKTPSGKIQRHRCRQLLDAGRFRPLATVETG